MKKTGLTATLLLCVVHFGFDQQNSMLPFEWELRKRLICFFEMQSFPTNLKDC